MKTPLKLMLVVALLSCPLIITDTLFAGEEIGHLQGEMSGEATKDSIILQSRLTGTKETEDGDVPGMPGMARFEYSTDPEMKDSEYTEWIEAVADTDFIIKTKVRNLKPGTRYYYRLCYGPDLKQIKQGRICTFKTLQGITGTDDVSFVVVTGMNYDKFYFGRDGKPEDRYQGEDRDLGYPALVAMDNLKPDYFVGTGDNVYYDFARTYKKPAKTPAELRKKWHEQFVKKRYVDFFANTATYWEKDDHDYRANDTDPYSEGEPSHELGIRMFLEQIPVVELTEKNPLTYRTHVVNKHLQLWFVEGRDYRSANSMPDGPEKTIWGEEQKKWLKKTLKESRATYKILISPTPLVGPDRNSKIDNHVNWRGFLHEGNEFFAWLDKNHFQKKNFYLICGDRHWQYHTKHPTGFEEYSSGALVDANSMLGNYPGQKGSTDPEGKIRQYYSQTEASGGFLRCLVKEIPEQKKVDMNFEFYDENGVLLYRNIKHAKLN